MNRDITGERALLAQSVPLAGAVTMAVLPAGQQDDIQARLDLMNTLVADLPAGITRTAARPGPAPPRTPVSSRSPRAPGFAHCALPFSNTTRTGLSAACAASSPVRRPDVGLPAHYPEYDPGLSEVP